MDETLRIRIIAEIDQFKASLEEAERLIDKVSFLAEDELEALNGVFQSVGNKSRAVLRTMTGVVAGLGTAFLALGNSTKEYREGQAKLNTAFQTAGGSAEAAKKTYNDLYRVLGDDATAVEAANHLAQLTTNQEELGEWTRACQGIYATFGASLPIESLTEAANHSAKLGEVQGTLADALEWSGVNVDEFNDQLFWCNSESEREKLIRDTLNGIYGEAADNYETNAEGILAQNDAQIKLNEATAKLGEAAAPLMVILTELATQVLAELEPHLDDITAALTKVGEAIGSVLSWIVNHWELVSTLGTIILAISAAFSVFSAVMTVVNAVMLASPITWIILGIVAAIAAVVAIIVLCIKYWDEIKAAVVTAVDAVVNAIKTAWDWITNLFSSVGNWIYKTVIEPVANFFVGLWNTIVSAFHKVIDPWIAIIKQFASIIYDTVIQPIVKSFTGMWDKLKNGAKNAWDGIKSIFSSIATFFKDTFSKAWNGVKNIFSTGGKIFTGIKDGIVSAFKTIVNGIISGINKVVTVPFNALNTALSKIKGIEILGIKPFDWVTTIKVPQIPQLEHGGVLKKGQIGLLEGNGAEAVVPLEKNTEWLDRIAERLNQNSGSPTPIVLQVDGKTFAKTAVKTINDLTRQNGKLSLNLV